jgi:hypothetical protein
VIDERRKLENERTFRGANERIRTAQVDLGVEERPLPFVCECYDTGCRTVVLLTPAEYEAVRSGGEEFFVAPGHEGDDRVVETCDRYTVVEKSEG